MASAMTLQANSGSADGRRALAARDGGEVSGGDTATLLDDTARDGDVDGDVDVNADVDVNVEGDVDGDADGGPQAAASKDVHPSNEITSITRPRKRSSNTKGQPTGAFDKSTGDNSVSLRSQFVVVLVLVSLNNTFERKSLFLPFSPEVLRLGRQTNSKTLPNPDNGFFDSRVLSRQHAEIWVDRNTRGVMIKDAKSSNGTYVNNKRLSPDNTESVPCELKRGDVLELGIDIHSDDGANLLHKKIAAKVDRISIVSLQSSTTREMSLSPPSSSSASSSSAGPSLINNGFMSRIQPRRNKMDTLDVALFGDVDTTLEDLSALHIRHTMGGLFMKSGITNSTAVENAVKQISQEIYATKLGTAKLKSIQKVMHTVLELQHSNKELDNQRRLIQRKSADRVVEIRNELNQVRSELNQRDKRISSLELDLAQQRDQSTQLQARLSRLTEDLNNTKRQLDTETERASVAEAHWAVERQRVDNLQDIIKVKEKEQEDLLRSFELERKATVQNISGFNAASFNFGLNLLSSVFNALAIPLLSALGVTILGIGIMSLINAYNRYQ